MIGGPINLFDHMRKAVCEFLPLRRAAMVGEFLPLIKGSGRGKLVVVSRDERAGEGCGAGRRRMAECAGHAKDDGIAGKIAFAWGLTRMLGRMWIWRCESGIPGSG